MQQAPSLVIEWDNQPRDGPKSGEVWTSEFEGKKVGRFIFKEGEGVWNTGRPAENLTEKTESRENRVLMFNAKER